MKKLQDKICLITGGASGIGFTAAITFVKDGGIVYALDINEESMKKAEAKAKEQLAGVEGCGQFITKFVDVSKSESVNKCVEEIIEKHGQIDVLVNNAGITADATLLKMTEEQFDRVINVNLKGVFLMTSAVVKHMASKKSGSIVNTTSIVGVYGNFGQTNYAAAKAGLIGMTKTWAKELGRKGIRVNAVAPGFTRTEMIESVPEKVINMLEEKTPMQRLGLPEEVANLYKYLASDDSNFITGQTIGIDGGLVL